jgi:prepilin peptidase CpaA
LGGAFLALVLHLAFGGLEGLQATTLGAAVGLGLFLPFYLLGGMAAGDVKLVAAVGALIGPKLVLIAGAFTLITGALLALGYLALRGDVVSWSRRWALVAKNTLVTRSMQTAYIAPAQGEVAGQRFPYALAVAIGTILAIGLYGAHAPIYMQAAS